MLLGGPLAAPAGLAAATEVSPPTTPAPTEAPTEAPAPARTPPPDRPNIVLILMDDFSLELLATMPHAQRMATQGATYQNAFVIDSLCCPSRAALLTGQTPHQTGVLTNTPNDPDNAIGGYRAFVQHGNERRQFSVALQRNGYRTGFIGKFMNGYEAGTVDGVLRPPPPVPGWTDWQAILGGGYNGWGFTSTYLDQAGQVRLRHHPKPDRSAPVAELDRAYATNVASRKAVAFLEGQQPGDAPYFLEIATYGPHSQLQKAYPDSPQFPSALADRAPAGDAAGPNCGTKACGDLTLRDLVGYDDVRGDNAPTYLRADGTTAPAPAWRTNEVSLTANDALVRYRDRARMVQSIDRLVAKVRERPARTPTCSSPPTTVSTSASTSSTGARGRRTTRTAACRWWSSDRTCRPAPAASS